MTTCALATWVVLSLAAADRSPASTAASAPAPSETAAPTATGPALLSEGSSGPEIALRRGLFSYGQGEYQKALATLEPLAGPPPQLTREADLADLRRTLGILLFIADRKNEAREQFEWWLLMDASAELDPYSTAPTLLTFFNDIKKNLGPTTAEMARLQKERQRNYEAPRLYERTLQPKLEFLCYLPFGIGQFQNGEVGMGLLFLGLEVAFLAVNIAGYVYGQLIAEPDGRILSTTSNRRKFTEALVLQYVGLGSFVTTWTIGAIHARVRFRPWVVREQKGPIIADPQTFGMMLEAQF